jgi:hypothetical protein
MRIGSVVELAVGLVVFIALIAQLDKRDSRRARQSSPGGQFEQEHHRSNVEQRHPEGWRPDEREHRRKEERYWSVQNTIAPIALISSLVAVIAASVSAYFAARALIATNRQAVSAEETLKLTKENFITSERPYVWLTDDLNAPQIIQNRAGMFQVIWDWRFTNYGKLPALQVRTTHSIKTDGQTFVESYGALPDRGAILLPPSAKALTTAVSAPEASREEFDKFLDISRSFGISGTITYTDANGGQYVSTFCLERLNSGTISYCLTGNDMK